jgi:hypothetical protein
LDVAFSAEREQRLGNLRDNLYKTNDRFLEICVDEYGQPGFPLQYTGKLIKIMQWGLASIVPHEYMVVLMQRNIEEIRQSYHAAFGHYPMQAVLGTYEQSVSNLHKEMQSRKDVQIDLLDYRTVLDSPQETIESLKQHGWPIDVERAAKYIDPSCCRFRLENLLVGAGGGYGVA